MARQQLTNLDFGNVAKIINLPDPVADQDAATKKYVDAAVEGISWKANARVYAPANINISSPGATVDGVTMAANDRVVLGSQTTQSQNGIYIWNGPSTPMTRSADANTWAELVEAVITIAEGTSANATFRQTAVTGTLGTTAIAFASFGTSTPAATEATAGIAKVSTQALTDAGTDDATFVTPKKLAAYAGAKKKYSTAIGDGTATQYTVTHNLGTRDINAVVYRNSGAYDVVNCDVEHATVNTVVLRFASAPASNAFQCVVIA